MTGWTPLLISHVAAASLGIVLGAVQLWRRPRGGAAHRLIGRVWVALMMWAAISSFWIRELNDGAFSWLHVLSVVTVAGAVNGVIQVRRGRLMSHRIAMISTWVGSVIAFVFAVAVPARHIPTYAVTNPGGAAAFGLSILAGAVLLVVLSNRAGRQTSDGRGFEAEVGGSAAAQPALTAQDRDGRA